MEKDWAVIYETTEDYQAEMARVVLKDNGIESVVMNKKDRVYQIGSIEVYVARNNVIRGKKIISDLEV